MTETESRRLTIRQTVICAVIAVLIAVIGMILSGKGITKYISLDSDVSSADALPSGTAYRCEWMIPLSSLIRRRRPRISRCI